MLLRTQLRTGASLCARQLVAFLSPLIALFFTSARSTFATCKRYVFSPSLSVFLPDSLPICVLLNEAGARHLQACVFLFTPLTLGFSFLSVPDLIAISVSLPLPLFPSPSSRQTHTIAFFVVDFCYLSSLLSPLHILYAEGLALFSFLC